MATTKSKTLTKETTNFTSGMTSEADYSVQNNLLQAQIRTQKLHQQTHQLRGETAKAEKKSLWADRMEVQRDTERVKLQIDQDNLEFTTSKQLLNKEANDQTLATKEYKVSLQKHKNSGTRQSLLNAGIEVK